jgi:predicted transcriptional regulator of viral defense system
MLTNNQHTDRFILGGFMKLTLNDEIPELDYCLLKNLLNEHKFVRNAILKLMQNSILIGVKKGIYVNTKTTVLPSLGILANMIYGPSYLSQEYALYHYGLIPEQPKVVTSMTLKMRRSFKTPFGTFNYEQIKRDRFFVETTRAIVDNQRSFIIATPEKALCDRFSRTPAINTPQKALDYCVADLRIEPE